MKRWLIDIVLGIVLALGIATVVLFSTYNSTFLYQGF